MLSIAQMKKISKENGRHWFDKSAMECWGSRIETKPDANNRFISSEENFDGTERLFTIRHFDPKTGCVTDVSEFQEFTTLNDAKQALKQL